MSTTYNNKLLHAFVRRYDAKPVDIPSKGIHTWKELILLNKIQDKKGIMLDEYWFEAGKLFKDLDASTSDFIEFEAQVIISEINNKYVAIKRPRNLSILLTNAEAFDFFPEETARHYGTGVVHAIHKLTIQGQRIDADLPGFNSYNGNDDDLDIFDTCHYRRR